MFGLAGLLLERALEDGSLAPAALAPAAAPSVPAGSAISMPAASAGQQLAKPARQATAVSKYDGLRQMLRQAAVEQVGRLSDVPACHDTASQLRGFAGCPGGCRCNGAVLGLMCAATLPATCVLPAPFWQDCGLPKFDPFPALAGWAAAPTLTRWQQYALAGEYDRYDPVAQLLQAAKAASSRPASHSKYCPVSALLRLLHGDMQAGTAAAAPTAPPPALAIVASNSEDEPTDQCSRLLAALARAAAQPGMQVGWPGRQCGWDVGVRHGGS